RENCVDHKRKKRDMRAADYENVVSTSGAKPVCRLLVEIVTVSENRSLNEARGSRIELSIDPLIEILSRPAQQLGKYSASRSVEWFDKQRTLYRCGHIIARQAQTFAIIDRAGILETLRRLRDGFNAQKISRPHLKPLVVVARCLIV